MTAREFVDNYRPSIMACVKSMEYKADEVAKKIMATSPEIQFTDDYRETQDVYIDETMSCDAGEVVRCMIHFGKMAIQYGIDTKNLDWKVKFIVAWDISHRVTEKDREWVA